MKVLVYGAGVLGSYLAHELHCGGHKVAVLARGRRYEELSKNGLIIEHVRQKTRTTDRIEAVTELMPDDEYDFVFVVMQKSQLADILPALAKNTASKRIVFIGNNCKADETYSRLAEMSRSEREILFGFLGCGGHREAGVIYNWHGNSCEITLGALSGDCGSEAELRALFSSTALKPVIMSDMDAWLKYHSALITPVCLAIQQENGETKRLIHSKPLRLSIQAVKENIKMLERAGFRKDPPHDMALLGWPTWAIQFALACFLPTKTGHFAAIDHALAAVDEIDMLARELLGCAEEYHYPLPALKELYSLKNT